MRKKTAIVVALIAAFLCIASLSSVSAQCDKWVECDSWCCYPTYTISGWFYNETTGSWSPEPSTNIALFHLLVDGDSFNAYCIDYETTLGPGDEFWASILPVEPTCKNNSIAYILNNWTHDCGNCPNVAAAQSAIWYFWYIDEGFCLGGTPMYNHTAVPPVESRWIPNCADHPAACTMVNTSINKSVPYNITIDPKTGDYPEGTSIPLESTVTYCLGASGDVVTVVFKADDANCKFENGASEYENVTVGGIAKATLTCDTGVDSVNVTARVKDMKWFEIVEPCEDIQPVLRIIDVFDDAAFTFSTQEGDIGIDKLVDDVKKEEVTYGQTVTYTLNITNTGVVNLTNIMVVDTLPADIIWADNASPLEDSVVGGKVITWKSKLPPLLIPGESFEINFNATVNESAECDKIYRNWATVNATTEPGEPVGPEESYADVFIDCPAEVPVLTPFGIAALIGLLSLVVVLSIRKKGERG